MSASSRAIALRKMSMISPGLWAGLGISTVRNVVFQRFADGFGDFLRVPVPRMIND
jgi:hypothetical protein